MDRAQVVQTVEWSRLIAILRLNDLSQASQLVRTLLKGGIKAIELTMTNSDAPRVVSELLKEIPEFGEKRAVLGLGSVRTVAEARTAIDSGANFLVSPTSLETVIREAHQANVAVFPGAFTPTEIALANHWGADIVKLFPARGLGPDYLRDILAPMPTLKLMPTGGINLENMRSYFDAGAVAVGLGGQLIQQQWIDECNWPQIEKAARITANAARPVEN